MRLVKCERCREMPRDAMVGSSVILVYSIHRAAMRVPIHSHAPCVFGCSCVEFTVLGSVRVPYIHMGSDSSQIP